MAKIVLGLGSSHTPMISEPPEFWLEHGKNDQRSRELISPRSFQVMPYDELEAEAEAQFASHLTPETFQRQYDQLQRGVSQVADRKSTRLNSSHIQKSRMPSSA